MSTDDAPASEPLDQDRIVETFISSVLDLMARLRADEPIGLGQRLGELLNDVRQARRPAQGQAAPQVEYAVHGAGARFTVSGCDVDLDYDTKRYAAIWDEWRVQDFARSKGIETDSTGIESAMRRHPDVVEIRPGWFSLRSDLPANTEAILVHDPSAITRKKAVDLLLDELPEFAPYYQDSDGRPTEPGDELLIHVVMGDLARFYMENALADPDLQQRYWSAVERLAVDGDQAVENAVHVSLIEAFGWGSQREQTALREARDQHGPATNAIVTYFLGPRNDAS
jgi:hypothetical protein